MGFPEGAQAEHVAGDGGGGLAHPVELVAHVLVFAVEGVHLGGLVFGLKGEVVDIASELEVVVDDFAHHGVGLLELGLASREQIASARHKEIYSGWHSI